MKNYWLEKRRTRKQRERIIESILCDIKINIALNRFKNKNKDKEVKIHYFDLSPKRKTA